MKYLICIAVAASLFLSSSAVFSASARCQVVGKKGNVLIMDCGEQAEGFTEKSQVKIKTDREQGGNKGK